MENNHEMKNENEIENNVNENEGSKSNETHEEKKKRNLLILVSCLFFIAAIGGFSGENHSMAVIWMCLGAAFLCFASVSKKSK